MNASEKKHLLLLRAAEVDSVNVLLPARSKILEIGGGNGYQAKLLADQGHEVISVDIVQSNYRAEFFDIQKYDGVHLNQFSDASFDAVFSSNVLEHVVDLKGLLAEISRVLKPNGIEIHLMPSVSWRLFTFLLHWFNLPKLLIGKFRKMQNEEGGSAPVYSKVALNHPVLKLAGLNPHGEFPTALHELWTYRSAWWQQMFERLGRSQIVIKSSPLFYTGHATFKFLPLSVRRWLSHLFGSACNVFVIKKSL